MMTDLHPSLSAAWAAARAEASYAGHTLIEPAHFLLGLLQVVDGIYQQHVDASAFPPETLEAIEKVSRMCREGLGMSDEELTKARRDLRRALRERGKPQPLVKELRPSPASLEMFTKVAAHARLEGSSQLSLLHLLTVIDKPAAGDSFYEFGLAAVVNFAEPGEEAPVTSTPPQAGGQMSVLDGLGLDLSAQARAGKLAPVTGREAEMMAVVRYLQRTTKRNVILTGEAGVGKTAIVEGLAQKLSSNTAPEFLRSLRIVQINVADLVAGAKYHGELEERLKSVMAEATSDPNLVLFIDEVHMVMRGGGDSPSSIANILKPALTRDDFRCIGATTTEEYERYIKDDAAFMRRFQVLRVLEPTVEESLKICRERARRIESLQGVSIEEGAVEAAVTLSAELIRGRSLPDKAIDLLEDAAASAKVSSLSGADTNKSGAIPVVGPQQIEEILEEKYGITVSPANALDAERVDSFLRKEIVGQEVAIQDIVESLQALSGKMSNAHRCLGALMFTGPTGVGKTFAAECLALALFQGQEDDSFLRVNMSEYKDHHELARLIGSPPGYVGHERQGTLFRFVAAHPQGLILLDEMEKAHPEIHDYFLQIFDKGEASDSRGRKADFRRHLFIMTCNITDADVRDIGFLSRATGDTTEKSDASRDSLLEHFRQEFLARVDRIVAFRPLTSDDYSVLCQRRVELFKEELVRVRGVHLEIREHAERHLYALCADPNEGARGLLKRFERLFVSPVIDRLKTGDLRVIILEGWDGDYPVFSES